MKRALARKLMGKKAHPQLLKFLRDRLPRLVQPSSRTAWLRKAGRLRAQVLDLFFRGHPPGLLKEKPRVRWQETLHTGKGYCIRKLLYEGYPGLWVPALLYEPVPLKGKVPAVLNPIGHFAGGKATDWQQARCLNLARRGLLALNVEFIGMGELRASADHSRIGQLDLCGVSGVGVFYLLMKRGLDVLLSHPHADPERVAMTGLSGGGWQTVVLSALDERVRAVIPVAGHSAMWQRIACLEDIGDQEQCPSDLCTAADFDAITALCAPRPTLLIYNRYDDCCYQTRRTRKSIYKPVKPIFQLLGAADKLAFHDNVDPGTHNYERDNRCQLYKFLNKHFGLDTPQDDLPWQEELYTEEELKVGLPADNATLLSLAQDALRRIRGQKRKKQAPSVARKRLADLLHLPQYERVHLEALGVPQKRKGHTLQHHLVHLDDTWTLPLTEFVPPRPRDTEVLVADGGRRALAAQVEAALKAGRRALAIDVFGTGELNTGAHYHMLIATAGERSLGIQVGQFLAILGWMGRKGRVPHLRAVGQVMPIAALMAAALRPQAVASLTTSSLLNSLGHLIEWPLAYASAAPLFCFGLLKEFDIPDLIALSAPVPLGDTSNRAPLRLQRK
jgi:dienelactone hydrolase